MKLTCWTILAITAIACATSTLHAQPGRGGFSAGGFDTSLFMLQNESVQKELELVPEQQEKLRAAGEKMRDEMREAYSGLRDLNAEERQEKFAEMREKMAEMQKDLRKEVDEILLPQQRDRLKQINFQMQNRRGGSTGNLSGDAVVEALDISESQLAEMKEKEAEVREELTKKIAEAQKEAREELLKVLTPAQRKKYDELMGQPFEFQWQQGGGDRGGRGNRDDRPQT